MLRPGLLDRLCEDPLDSRSEGAEGEGLTFPQYLDTIKRDLQELLNTRRAFTPEALAAFPEARRSLLLYGLPDFGPLSSSSDRHRERLIAAIEAAIATFEPRLMGARIVPIESTDMSREVRFRVEGFVRADPLPARIVFDTSIDLEQQTCRIESGDPERGKAT